MTYKVIAAPAEEPVSLAQAKNQCRVDLTDDDALISLYIQTAREQAEHRTGRLLITQTIEVPYDAFPTAEIELPVPGVQSIQSIQYLDTAGVLRTLSNTLYTLDNYGLKNWIFPAIGTTWPDTLDSANAVKIQLVVGYGTAAAVPSSLKNWILIAVETFYSNRGDLAFSMHQNELPRDFFDGLLDPYRIVRL